MGLTKLSRTLLLSTALLAPSCAQRNELKVEGGNPPTLSVSGEGILDGIRISGPAVKIAPPPEDSLRPTEVYWEIAPIGELNISDLQKRGSITYGQLPEGFRQVYPEHGAPPLLFDEGLFGASLQVRGKGGANFSFTIRKGKVIVEGS
jgi:hypothetical protein